MGGRQARRQGQSHVHILGVLWDRMKQQQLHGSRCSGRISAPHRTAQGDCRVHPGPQHHAVLGRGTHLTLALPNRGQQAAVLFVHGFVIQILASARQLRQARARWVTAKELQRHASPSIHGHEQATHASKRAGGQRDWLPLQLGRPGNGALLVHAHLGRVRCRGQRQIVSCQPTATPRQHSKAGRVEVQAALQSERCHVPGTSLVSQTKRQSLRGRPGPCFPHCKHSVRCDGDDVALGGSKVARDAADGQVVHGGADADTPSGWQARWASISATTTGSFCRR